MVLTLSLLLNIFMLVPAGLGVLMLGSVFILNKKAPMDSSNRINHMRLVWWAITKPHHFVHLYPWMKNDEGDNVEGTPKDSRK